MAKYERLGITDRKQIFLSLLPQNILRIFEHLRKWRSLYMRETLYIGIASSLQTSGFVKCFIHKILSKSSLN